MKGQEEWLYLQDLEEKYLELIKSKLSTIRSNQDADFVGFAYRGISVHGGRAHTFQISPRVDSKLREAGCSSPTSAVRLGIELYLSAYGKPTTFNNLGLETVWSGDSSWQRSAIRLRFGTQHSGIEALERRVEINVSSRLLQHLSGNDGGWWEQLFFDLAAAGGTADAPERLAPFVSALRSRKHAIREAAHFALFEETAFAKGLIKTLLPGWTEGDGPGDPLLGLRQWLGAFQGLLLLSHTLGANWLSVPVEPRFGGSLPSHLSLPRSALTAVTSGEREVDHSELIAAGENIGHCEKSEEKVSAHLFFEDVLAEGSQNLLSAVFPKWKYCFSSGSVGRFPALPGLLRLASELRRAEHEGKPLSFTLLCAPDSHLLRLHWRSLRWALAEIQHLKPKGAGESEKEIADELKNNAFILQAPGRAVYFRPNSLAPAGVVEFRPFHQEESSRYLREFTGDITAKQNRDNEALAIRVDPQGAQIFAGGRLVALLQTDGWEPAGKDLLSLSGAGQLEEAVKETDWWSRVRSDRKELRLGSICSAVVSVAERRYGALFFLVSNELGEPPPRTTMAPVWAKDRFVEFDKAEYIASFAGLDGETYVDIELGHYYCRQFTLVPEERFLKFFDDEGEWTPEFKTYLEKCRIKLELPTGDDSLLTLGRRIEHFGTRHLKALRITYAFPESAIAITCSSSGPIRLWQRGIETKKFGPSGELTT